MYLLAALAAVKLVDSFFSHLCRAESGHDDSIGLKRISRSCRCSSSRGCTEDGNDSKAASVVVPAVVVARYLGDMAQLVAASPLSPPVGLDAEAHRGTIVHRYAHRGRIMEIAKRYKYRLGAGATRQADNSTWFCGLQPLGRGLCHFC
jgi:hypothetical protein